MLRAVSANVFAKTIKQKTGILCRKEVREGFIQYNYDGGVLSLPSCFRVLSPHRTTYLVREKGVLECPASSFSLVENKNGDIVQISVRVVFSTENAPRFLIRSGLLDGAAEEISYDGLQKTIFSKDVIRFFQNYVRSTIELGDIDITQTASDVLFLPMERLGLSLEKAIISVEKKEGVWIGENAVIREAAAGSYSWNPEKKELILYNSFSGEDIRSNENVSIVVDGVAKCNEIHVNGDLSITGNLTILGNAGRDKSPALTASTLTLDDAKLSVAGMVTLKNAKIRGSRLCVRGPVDCQAEFEAYLSDVNLLSESRTGVQCFKFTLVESSFKSLAAESAISCSFEKIQSCLEILAGENAASLSPQNHLVVAKCVTIS